MHRREMASVTNVFICYAILVTEDGILLLFLFFCLIIASEGTAIEHPKGKMTKKVSDVDEWHGSHGRRK